MSEPDQFEQLEDLRRRGILNDAEFNNAWSKLLAQQQPVVQQPVYYQPPPPAAGPANYYPSPRPRFPVKWAVIAGCVIAVAIALVVVKPWSSGAKAFTAHGTLQLNGTGGPVSFDESDLNFLIEGGGCIGVNGYDDIVAGAQVTVADAAGKTLALGSLDGGTVGSGTCTFTFTIPGVPAGKKFYQVTVSHRGGLQFTEPEMRAGISATLGS